MALKALLLLVVVAVVLSSTEASVQTQVVPHGYLRGANLKTIEDYSRPQHLLKVFRKSALFEDMVTVYTYYQPKSAKDNAEDQETGLAEVYPARRRLTEWYEGCVRRALVAYEDVMTFLKEHANLLNAQQGDSLLSKDAADKLQKLFDEEDENPKKTNSTEWLTISEDDVSPRPAGKSSSLTSELSDSSTASNEDTVGLSFLTKTSQDSFGEDFVTPAVKFPSRKELEQFAAATAKSLKYFASLDSTEK